MLCQGEKGNKFPGKSYQQIGLKTSLFIGFPIEQQLTQKKHKYRWLISEKPANLHFNIMQNKPASILPKN
jgi:hypothetical protein